MLSKLKIPIALALALAGVGWLAWRGVARNDLYMATLDQWDPARSGREPVRLVGFVKDGSIEEDRDRLVTRFLLRNESSTRSVPVVYTGVTPDLFRDGASVVVSGAPDAEGAIVATDLMTKCPSKYEGAEAHPGSAQAGAAAATPGT